MIATSSHAGCRSKGLLLSVACIFLAFVIAYKRVDPPKLEMGDNLMLVVDVFAVQAPSMVTLSHVNDTHAKLAPTGVRFNSSIPFNSSALLIKDEFDVEGLVHEVDADFVLLRMPHGRNLHHSSHRSKSHSSSRGKSNGHCRTTNRC